MFNKEEYKKVINVPLSVIVASLITIIITTGMTDTNALSALIGGYSGLLLGLLFILILNYPPSNWMDMFPFLTVIVIVSILIAYLSKYFEQIASGEVSSYYSSFSILCNIFLVLQLSILLSAMFSKSDPTGKLFSDKTFALLSLFGVVNMVIVITIGIVLHFYSTQG
jgi:F0F1-type ATP synthase assembly protein I